MKNTQKTTVCHLNLKLHGKKVNTHLFVALIVILFNHTQVAGLTE